MDTNNASYGVDRCESFEEDVQSQLANSMRVNHRQLSLAELGELSAFQKRLRSADYQRVPATGGLAIGYLNNYNNYNINGRRLSFFMCLSPNLQYGWRDELYYGAIHT